jgi:hypothetical protein
MTIRIVRKAARTRFNVFIKALLCWGKKEGAHPQQPLWSVELARQPKVRLVLALMEKSSGCTFVVVFSSV